MVETYKIIEDELRGVSIEITDTMQSKRVIDKKSIIDEIVRLEELLNRFPPK